MSMRRLDTDRGNGRRPCPKVMQRGLSTSPTAANMIGDTTLAIITGRGPADISRKGRAGQLWLRWGRRRTRSSVRQHGTVPGRPSATSGKTWPVFSRLMGHSLQITRDDHLLCARWANGPPVMASCARRHGPHANPEQGIPGIRDDTIRGTPTRVVYLEQPSFTRKRSRLAPRAAADRRHQALLSLTTPPQARPRTFGHGAMG